MMMQTAKFRALGRLFLAAALGAVAAGAPAGGQSLKSLRAQDSEERALQSEASFTNSVCGGDIEARIEWGSTSGWPDGESLAEACGGALGALEAICRSGGRDRAQKVSTFICSGDGSGPSLSGSTFYYGASPGYTGFDDSLDYLEGAL